MYNIQILIREKSMPLYAIILAYNHKMDIIESGISEFSAFHFSAFHF